MEMEIIKSFRNSDKRTTGVRSSNDSNTVKPQLSKATFKCRICLDLGNIPIYNNSESELCDNVCLFGDIVIRQDDLYPKYLCEFCFSDLQTAVHFRRTARKSDRILKHQSDSRDSTKTFNANGDVIECQSVEVIQFVNKSETPQLNDEKEEIRSCLSSPSDQAQGAEDSDNDSVHPIEYELNITEDETVSQCLRCDQTVLKETWKDHYSTHDNPLHRRKSLMKCQLCTYEAHNPEVLHTHLLSVHSNEKKYVCGSLNKEPVFAKDNESKSKQGDQESVKREKLTNIPALYHSDIKENSLLPSVYKKYFKPTNLKNIVRCDICDRTIHKNSRREHFALHDPNSAFRFQCDICGQAFRQKNAYNLHTRKGHATVQKTKKHIFTKHNESKPTECNQESFKHETMPHMPEFQKDSLLPSIYNKHFKATSDRKIVQCQICSKTVHIKSCKDHYTLHNPGLVCRFQYDKTFEHRLVHNHKTKLDSNNDTLKLKCKLCSFEGSTTYKLYVHMLTHKKHWCDLCPRRFLNTHSLISHKLTHEQKFNLIRKPVPEYDKYFKQIDQINNHQMVQCRLCNKTMKKMSRRGHYENMHNTQKQEYLCDVCGKSFKMWTNYINHKTTHTNEFPFECKLCPYKGRTSDLLKSHGRIHSDKVLYQCDVCSKGFNFKSNLVRHIRRHLNKPQYKCDVCNRMYMERFALTHHYKTRHLGEMKTVACELCEKTYASKKYLRKHQTKVHGIRKGRRADYKMLELHNKKEG